MQTISDIAELRALRREWQLQGLRIGFVPTMGNLHLGHLSLVEAAKKDADIVVVSIFVNPMQFGAGEDLDNYPRTLAEDSAQLAELGVDVIFTPTAKGIYPRGLEQQTFVEVPGISYMICGASRPGHFRGVATVVTKLFNMVQPNIAYFGEKDYQQVQVIKAMVEDLSMNLDIVSVPTMRHDDGLAMSSRNGYLNEQQHTTQGRAILLLQPFAIHASADKGHLVHRLFHRHPLNIRPRIPALLLPASNSGVMKGFHTDKLCASLRPRYPYQF